MKLQIAAGYAATLDGATMRLNTISFYLADIEGEAVVLALGYKVQNLLCVLHLVIV